MAARAAHRRHLEEVEEARRRQTMDLQPRNYFRPLRDFRRPRASNMSNSPATVRWVEPLGPAPHTRISSVKDRPRLSEIRVQTHVGLTNPTWSHTVQKDCTGSHMSA